MNKILILLIGVLGFYSCESPQGRASNYQNSDIVVTPVATNLGDNLDLQALGELVKTCNTAQEIETKLNAEGSINNLDLDNNGSVDYIQVVEYGSGNSRGFSFTTDNSLGEKQEIATIEMQNNNSNVVMNIQGNQTVYGGQSNYTSNYLLRDMMIYHYLFSYHPYYHSPYHYGYYPSAYRSYRSMPISSYRNRVSSTTRTTKITRTTTRPSSTIKSPNASYSSKSVNSRASSLKSPTRSQKSFSVTSQAKSRPNTSGFGSSNRSSSSRNSFGSSSRSSSSRSSSRRSDVRFKDNIQPLNNSLNYVCSLNGVTYDWKVNSFPKENFNTSKQIGFLAQDLEKVYPSLVHDRGDGYKVVDYDLLVPALVEAIKELNRKSIKQDSVINALTVNK